MQVRLFDAFKARQRIDGCANNVLRFIQEAVAPVRFIKNSERFEALRERLNKALLFYGYSLTESGELRQVPPARTLTEAQRRASRLRAELVQRKVHPDVLKFCRAELIEDNYFHAFFEATKSVAEKIRQRTGLTRGWRGHCGCSFRPLDTTFGY
jgi:hypothetical protein